MQPSKSSLQQMTQLFSPDGATPAYRQVICHKQHGSTDCGIFAIAYAIDILNSQEPHKYIYDQSKMRQHLINCFISQQMTQFPKYNLTEEKRIVIKPISQNQEETWNSSLRRSKRIQQQKSQNFNLTLSNRFEISLSSENSKTAINTPSKQITSINASHQITPVIHNISSIKLNQNEIKLLEKGLNFCPSSYEVNKEEVMDDLYNFCRNLRLKEYFYNNNENETINEIENTTHDRCTMKSSLKNPYFNPPINSSSNLEKYIASIKTDVTKSLSQEPNRNKSNLSLEERNALQSLRNQKDITIKRADKGGKIVLLDTEQYIKDCKKQLQNETFYQVLEHDPTQNICQEIKHELNEMITNEQINRKEYKFLSKNLEQPRTPIFYGLPKIHKTFFTSPPLRPIISGFNSCTANLSKYLDSFLKFQARKCESYIRDTKDFLIKINNISNLPKDCTLITMDVSSLYTNIDHLEGAEACYEALEKRKNKTVPSILLKKLILIVLKSNVFRFGETLFKQIMGTAMGTPMAPNYANLFLDKFEREMLQTYHSKTGEKPLVWYRYIDDIFCIWNHGDKSLQKFISFCQEYSEMKNMKSNIKFECNISKENVNFLDVSISIKDNKLNTTVYNKPTDAHLYLNPQSCHPNHVIKNIPKGQFIRIKRICSSNEEFVKHSNILRQHFINRGFSIKTVSNALNQVNKIDRKELLKNSQKETKDSQTTFVLTWHPKLKPISSIIKKNYNIISNDPKLSTIFPDKPTVAYRRRKNLGNILTKTDIIQPQMKESQHSCECKICKTITRTNMIKNDKKNISLKLKPTNASCKSTGVVYVAKCKKHNLLYVGQTGKKLSKRFSDHRYDTKNRPENNELAYHFSKPHHNFDNDLQLFIVEQNVFDPDHRLRLEDKWICRLQSRQPNGLNTELGNYAKELYRCYSEI